MSWESIASKDLLCIPPSQNHSATHLLTSPDGSRYLLDNSNELSQLDESFSRVAGCGSSPDAGSRSFWTSGQELLHTSSVIGCFLSCQQSLKQYIAKRKIERGRRLYEQNNQAEAVRTWRSALKDTCQREDCFQLLGYLYQAHMDWGKFREAIEFSHQQLGISEELDSPNMRAETYLNLSRAHASLGGLERSLSYARHSLYNECGTKCRSGLVHLTVARVYLEMGGFSRALEGLQGAYKIAMAIGDPSLELQVYVALSELFGRLQDIEKSATYASKAYDLSRSLQLGDLNSCHHRAALLRMAVSLRKQGELGDAQDYCKEATKLSLISGDQATFTRSLRIMGDIYRKKMDMDLATTVYNLFSRLFNHAYVSNPNEHMLGIKGPLGCMRAFRQYEQAMGTSASLGDRMAQMEAMDGAARCLEMLRLQNKICNCRPLEFNTRLLEVASSIGAKFLVRKIRCRLALIYRALGDEDQYNSHFRLANQTDAALGLNCGACGELFGLQPENLEALPCAHILHARCAYEILRRRDKNTQRSCPACNNLMTSRMHLSGSGVIPAETESTDEGGSSAINANVLSINGLFGINSDSLLPSTVFCNINRSMPSDTENVTLIMSPKAMYLSNLSLASLSMRASSLTIDSDRQNATSSV